MLPRWLAFLFVFMWWSFFFGCYATVKDFFFLIDLIHVKIIGHGYIYIYIYMKMQNGGLDYLF